jgi:hypothetical protein
MKESITGVKLEKNNSLYWRLPHEDVGGTDRVHDCLTRAVAARKSDYTIEETIENWYKGTDEIISQRLGGREGKILVVMEPTLIDFGETVQVMARFNVEVDGELLFSEADVEV